MSDLHEWQGPFGKRNIAFLQIDEQSSLSDSALTVLCPIYAYVTCNITICHLLINLNKVVITVDHNIVQVCSECSVSQNPGDGGIAFNVIRTDSVIE